MGECCGCDEYTRVVDCNGCGKWYCFRCMSTTEVEMSGERETLCRGCEERYEDEGKWW